jgi:hypothetical protein
LEATSFLKQVESWRWSLDISRKLGETAMSHLFSWCGRRGRPRLVHRHQTENDDDHEHEIPRLNRDRDRPRLVHRQQIEGDDDYEHELEIPCLNRARRRGRPHPRLLHRHQTENDGTTTTTSTIRKLCVVLHPSNPPPSLTEDEER